jgi:hypothetical protein
MLTQILPAPSVATAPSYAPQCGQCRYFVPIRERITEFGLQIRPSYCKLLAQADCDNTRKVASEKVCRQYEEFIPF